MLYVLAAIIIAGSVAYGLHKVRRKADEFGMPHSFIFR
jgi:hypothetical protein